MHNSFHKLSNHWKSSICLPWRTIKKCMIFYNYPKLLSGEGIINDSTHLLLTSDQMIRTFVDKREPNAKMNPLNDLKTLWHRKRHFEHERRTHRSIFSGRLHNFHLNTCLWRFVFSSSCESSRSFSFVWPGLSDKLIMKEADFIFSSSKPIC